MNSIDSEQALSYLIEGLTPNVWRKRNVLGLAPWMTSYEGYDLLLSEYAVCGLGFSGHPPAREALRSLQQSPTADQARFRAGRDAVLKQWIEVNDLVAERGLAGMYKHYETQRQLARERELIESGRSDRTEALPLREAQEP